jgi:hypothetical protein
MSNRRFEDRRRELMHNKQPAWGDAPPSNPLWPLRPRPEVQSALINIDTPAVPQSISASMSTSRKVNFERTTAQITTQGWTLDLLIASGARFKRVPRVSANRSNLLKTIADYEEFGTPLIIEGLHNVPGWDSSLFTAENFEALSIRISDRIKARNVRTSVDSDILLSDLIRQLRNTPPVASGDGEF